MQKKIYNNILRLSQGGVEMVFKKAKLFWKNENDREIINSVFYDDSVEYYTFLRKCKYEGYRHDTTVAGVCNKKRIRNI